MKKQEVKIVKAAVQRSARLDQGMKVELGLTDAQESETVFTLGPAEGAVDVITLPLNGEPVLLALHELDTVAQMVRICVTPTICNCFFQGVGSFLDSMKEDHQYKGYTEGALWRLNLVSVLPTIALGEQRAKAISAELEMLGSFFWRSADKAE